MANECLCCNKVAVIVGATKHKRKSKKRQKDKLNMKKKSLKVFILEDEESKEMKSKLFHLKKF